MQAGVWFENPTTYNVTAFFLQLIALRIIEFKSHDNTKMICVLIEESPGKYKYKDPLAWKEMSFRMAKRGGALIDFAKVVHKHGEVIRLLNKY